MSKTRFSLGVENDWAGLRGTGRPNLSRAAQFLCAKGRPGKIGFNLPCSTDHEQGWQPYPVDAQCATREDHTHNCFYARDERHLPFTRAISQGLGETKPGMRQPCSAPPAMDRLLIVLFFFRGGSPTGRFRRGRNFRMTGKLPRERHRSKGRRNPLRERGGRLENSSGSSRAGE